MIDFKLILNIILNTIIGFICVILISSIGYFIFVYPIALFIVLLILFSYMFGFSLKTYFTNHKKDVGLIDNNDNG
jgi:hypothetical protein